MGLLKNLDLSRLAVAVAADEGYALPLAVTLSSLVRNLSEPVQVIVADCGLSARSRKFLQKIVASQNGPSIRYVGTHELTCLQVATTSWHGSATLARLQIPDFFLDDFDRILYLDSDVLVVSDVLQIEVPQTDTPVAVWAALEAGGPNFGAKPHLDTFGVDKSLSYFNAGVMLVDIQEWTRVNLGKRAIEYLEKSTHPLLHADQDALNLVLQGEWAEIDPRWNVQLDAIWSDVKTLDTRCAKAARTPGIYHYISPRKPWHLARPRAERISWILEAVRVCFGGGWFGARGIGWFVHQYGQSMVKRLAAK